MSTIHKGCIRSSFNVWEPGHSFLRSSLLLCSPYVRYLQFSLKESSHLPQLEYQVLNPEVC